jgi:hypothetical protein
MARFVASLILTVALLPATAAAAPGDLDRSFGSAGVAIFDWGGISSATGILVGAQPAVAPPVAAPAMGAAAAAVAAPRAAWLAGRAIGAP